MYYNWFPQKNCALLALLLVTLISSIFFFCKSRTVRKWKYHKDLKLWFKKQIVASEPLMPEQNRGIECGPFTYFDVNTWTKRVTPAEFTIEPSKVWQE